MDDNIHTLNIAIQNAVYCVQVIRDQHENYTIHYEDYIAVAKGALEGNCLRANIEGHQFCATIGEHNSRTSLYSSNANNAVCTFTLAKPDLGDSTLMATAGELTAPMNGTIVTILAEIGVEVKSGDALLIMEAMKMEHTIRAPSDGHVEIIFFVVGELVGGGIELLEFKASNI